MATLSLNHELLQKLCTVNQFTLPNVELVFIGLRGAVVSDANDQSFKTQQSLNVIDVNYINPRCTILQWRMGSQQLAAFPASTVPNQVNVKIALNGGDKANCLLTGYYKDYKKGIHKEGTSTGHEAFRQNAVRPFLRTNDDLDFDQDDRIEYNNPHDNIHCGWFQSLTSTNFASAGCQVVMGLPKCLKPGRDENTGPWKTFHSNAYAINQVAFPYVLVIGEEVLRLAENNPSKAKLRFGSTGPLVAKLQQTLKQQNLYQGNVDSDFGEKTMKAVITFQQQKMTAADVDGVVGIKTAEALGIDLNLG